MSKPCACKFKGRITERHEKDCPAMDDKEIITIGCIQPYGYIQCTCCSGWVPRQIDTLEALP
jgi:hypothetical protein